MGLSRRAFLTGVGAAAVTLALPPVRIFNDVPPWVPSPLADHIADAMRYLSHYGNKPPVYHLHAAQWRVFEESGMNMRYCRRIPPTVGDIT